MCANYFGVNALGRNRSGNVYDVQSIKNNPYLIFGQAELTNDTFQYSSNSTAQYVTEKYLTQAMNENPEIKRILEENGMIGELNMDNLSDILKAHAATTQQIAVGIAKHLPASMQYSVDTKALKDAGYLHDIGKVLIPDEILNKTDKLTGDEQKIMHTHSELGYELLKNSNLSDKTLNLIKYHHQNIKKEGYPAVNSEFNLDDINLQILSTADKYSALKEERPYKEALSDEKALAIIYKDVKEGKLDPMVFRALVEYTRQNTSAKVAA